MIVQSAPHVGGYPSVSTRSGTRVVAGHIDHNVRAVAATEHIQRARVGVDGHREAVGEHLAIGTPVCPLANRIVGPDADSRSDPEPSSEQARIPEPRLEPDA